MISRRNALRFILTAVGLAAYPARAQPQRVRRIGVLLGTDSLEAKPTLDAFRAALREAGWVEGQNLNIEYRWAEGKPERYTDLAADLVRLNPDAIITTGDQLSVVLKRATSSIPIVMVGVGNPVAAGLVASLARPGGNATGISNLAAGMPSKWLELIREWVPGIRRVAALRNLSNPTHDAFWEDTQASASKLGIVVIAAPYRNVAELTDALAAAAKQQASALIVLPDPLATAHRFQIAKLAEQYRWPSVFLVRESVVAGGLVSYGPNRLANYRLGAKFVDKILRGAKPAEMPVEQAREFELVINARTARALGIKVPEAVLLRAAEVIE